MRLNPLIALQLGSKAVNWPFHAKLGFDSGRCPPSELGEGSLSDFFVEVARGVVLNKLGQGCFVKPGKHITKLGRFRLAQRECLAINPSQDVGGADTQVPSRERPQELASSPGRGLKFKKWLR